VKVSEDFVIYEQVLVRE